MRFFETPCIYVQHLNKNILSGESRQVCCKDCSEDGEGRLQGGETVEHPEGQREGCGGLHRRHEVSPGRELYPPGAGIEEAQGQVGGRAHGFGQLFQVLFIVRF